ncbi:MAG: hypothetical protein KJZ80_00495 [Hyphomicrobiaceae bacterium]|nr:hypothetical protein [Hyphomicrobiaceae bacterium]
MNCMPAARLLPFRLVFALAGLAMTACSAGLDSASGSAGIGCVDDSSHCIEQRRTALHSIMSDKDRKWVREAPSPAAYASGVRLFAFKTRKAELSCDELALGRREADGAPAALRGPGSTSLTPAQVSRGLMLGAEVSRELAAEMKRRCRA